MSAVVAGGSPDNGRRRGRSYDGDREHEDAGRLKSEPDSDIKDYAETTMNELLGWYGLDKLDTRGLNLKNLNHHFPTSSSSSSPMRHEDDVLSEEDMGRRSRSPFIESESAISNASNETIICAWCLKTGLKLFTLKTSSGKTKVFCSEPCFNQCRRAAFKKNRVCNWCRHVRHTVNYVDFKDGDEQLQFCSDKCLNQYKMQIFCRETQAYLQMNPHLQEETKKNASSESSKLITPDLWLRDCQEPVNGAPILSHSDDEPASPNVRTLPNSSGHDVDLEDLSVKSKPERTASTPTQRESSHEVCRNSENSPVIKEKCSIDVSNAMTSYLDRDKSPLDRRKRHFESDREHFRKKQRVSSLRHRMNHHQEAPPAHLSSSAHPSMNFPGQNRLYHPSVTSYISPTATSQLNPPAAHSKVVPPHSALTGSLLPPGLPPPPPLLNNDFLHTQFNPQFFPSPLSSLSHQQQLEAILRLQSTLGRRPESFPPPHHFTPESTLSSARASPPQYTPGASLQPNTVMLPYPVLLPLPVPIPIPIPLSCFLKKDKTQTSVNSIQSSSRILATNGDKTDDKHLDVDADDPINSVPKKLKNFKLDSNDLSTKKEKLVSSSDTSYAITNNDSQTNRLILTRNKPR